jgi:hypothetical protein
VIVVVERASGIESRFEFEAGAWRLAGITTQHPDIVRQMAGYAASPRSPEDDIEGTTLVHPSVRIAPFHRRRV